MPLSAATTRYGSSPSKRTTRAGGSTTDSPSAVGHAVVGHVEQRRDEEPVAGLDLGAQRRRIGRGLLHDEAALRARRHDHGVLDLLRLHQPEDLGAEVFAAVRPADAAPRDAPGAQVHALDARRVHEQLEHRPGERQVGHERGIELQRDARAGARRRRRSGTSWCAASRARGAAARAGCGPRRGDATRVEIGRDLLRRSGSMSGGVACCGSKRAANSVISRRAMSGCAASVDAMYAWLNGVPICRR